MISGMDCLHVSLLKSGKLYLDAKLRSCSYTVFTNLGYDVVTLFNLVLFP